MVDIEPAKNDNTKEIWYKIAKYNKNESPSQEIELYKKMLNIFHVGDFYYFIFNCPTAQVEWTSNSVTKILGLSSEEEFTLSFILENIHPDDLPYFLDFENQVTAFFNQLPADKVLKYKVSYDYRIRRKDGKNIRILQQAITIQTNEKGAVIRVLDVHTVISHLKKENGSTLSFIGLEGEPSYYDVSKGKSVGKISKTILSKREKEILSHLVKGKNSGQIADSLFISRSTVEQHRKNMLRKTSTSSTVELAIRSLQENWYIFFPILMAI
ncbi:LuxR C-terminal-related transcriptional regulator [Pedobacter foliorum]|uniref:LuxR C-terminal-related transcriptional regulator n=1 Tax=Pedobacter foliorum TaxID=2739058 RepID=UPI0015634B43|nr:LuxR C-terminal-related transcriptional regulator [Pedobacter foliorum]NRF37961.1 PAS domain-containing protein [Pedobacter foliorum]